jgi:hypothetical protein
VYVCATSHYDQVSKVGGLEENLKAYLYSAIIQR